MTVTSVPTSVATPLVGDIDVETAADQLVASFRVAPEEPVFRGHYRDFPILPGVCLVECAQRSVVEFAAATGRTVRLVAVESSRFASPVFPDDLVELRGNVLGDPDGPEVRWRVTLSVGEHKVAAVRLRFRVAPA